MPVWHFPWRFVILLNLKPWTLILLSMFLYMTVRKWSHYILAYIETASTKLTWCWSRQKASTISCQFAIFHVLSPAEPKLMKLHMSARAVYIHSDLKTFLSAIAMTVFCFPHINIFIPLRERILWNSQIFPSRWKHHSPFILISSPSGSLRMMRVMWKQCMNPLDSAFCGQVSSNSLRSQHTSILDLTYSG